MEGAAVSGEAEGMPSAEAGTEGADRWTWGDNKEVTVGVDGSRAARQAVVWGAYEARLRRSPLKIVHVQEVATDAVGATTDLRTVSCWSTRAPALPANTNPTWTSPPAW